MSASWQNQQSDCAPSEDSDQPGHPPSLIRVFAVCMKKSWVLSYPLSTQRRPWSDWVDAQADLSLRWAHTHFVGFVMSRLSYVVYYLGMCPKCAPAQSDQAWNFCMQTGKTYQDVQAELCLCYVHTHFCMFCSALADTRSALAVCIDTCCALAMCIDTCSALAMCIDIKSVLCVSDESWGVFRLWSTAAVPQVYVRATVRPISWHLSV